MRVLLANLKHSYQHRVLMLMGVFYVLLSLTPFAQADGEGALATLILPEFAIGVTVAAMQMDVVSKTFSFCLPYHRVVVRRFIFLIGLAVSVALSLLFSQCPGQAGMTSDWPALVLSSTFSAGMIAYLSGAGIGLCVRIPVLILTLLPLIAIGGVLSDLHMRIESVVIHAPVCVIAAAMISGIIGWLWLGRPAWFCHRCARPWIGFSDFDDFSKMNQYGQARAWARPKTRTHPRIDGFFLGVMTRHARCERLRYVWGALYAAVLQIVLLWKGHLFMLLAVLLLAGYIPLVIPFIAGVHLPMTMISLLCPPFYFKSFVAAGRRERLIATIVLLTVLGSTAVLIVVSLAAMSNLIALWAPEISVGDFTFSFRAISVRAVWYPIIVFPIVGVLHILSYVIKSVLLVVLAVLLAFLLIVYFMFFARTPPIYVVGCVALSWIICLLVVYRITMRSDLGRK
jgi:hypothetical protein